LADRITERDQFSKSLIIARIAKIIRRVIA